MISSASMSEATARKSILFVDDEEKVLDAFRRMLRPFSEAWNVHFLSDSRRALDLVRDYRVDAVITDLCMPFVSGIDLIQELQKQDETKHVPIIVITGYNDRDLKRRALDAGAADLLTRPVQLEDLLARIRNSLRLKSCYDELNHRNAELEYRVFERTQQLRLSRLEIIARLAKAAECRDKDTGRHVVRVAHYSRLIAQELNLPTNEVDAIFASAPLHDVGKIAISDTILLKNGALTDEERRIMQTHCEVGEQILSSSVEDLFATRFVEDGSGNVALTSFKDPVLETARQIAATHHEHWDGRGYPHGLAGEQIPIAGRIVAVADVFDALTTARSYKPAFSMSKAIELMYESSGKQFDPTVFSAFLAILPEVQAIRLQLPDRTDDVASDASLDMVLETYVNTPDPNPTDDQRAAVTV